MVVARVAPSYLRNNQALVLLVMELALDGSHVACLMACTIGASTAATSGSGHNDVVAAFGG